MTEQENHYYAPQPPLEAMVGKSIEDLVRHIRSTKSGIPPEEVHHFVGMTLLLAGFKAVSGEYPSAKDVGDYIAGLLCDMSHEVESVAQSEAVGFVASFITGQMERGGLKMGSLDAPTVN